LIPDVDGSAEEGQTHSAQNWGMMPAALKQYLEN
jgi:hypothetical protein